MLRFSFDNQKKIKKAKAGLIKSVLKKPYHLSFATLDYFESIVVYIRTEDGAEGIGEAVALPGYSWENTADVLFVVNQIIDEITPEKERFTKPTLMVFNKIDQFKHETIDEDDLITEKSKAHYSLKDWKKTWMSKMNNNCVFISALKKENIDEFKSKVFEEVKKIHITRFPYNDFFYQEYEEK